MSQKTALISICPHCQASYADGQVTLVDIKKTHCIFHAQCADCCRSFLFSCQIEGERLLCTGLLTECSVEDVIRFKSAKYITLEDVFTVRKGLRLDNLMKMR